MRRLVENLKKVGLEYFIDANAFELYNKTLNQKQIAAFLNFDSKEINIINAPQDNFSKKQRLYKYIQRRVDVKNFLEALHVTGNEHVINFIRTVFIKDDFILAETSSFLVISPFVYVSITSVLMLGFSVYCYSYWSSGTGIWFSVPESSESFGGRADSTSQLHEKLQNPNLDEDLEVSISSQVEMARVIEKLEAFGLDKFVQAHRYYLCDNTVSPNKVAVALNFDPDQCATINHPPDNFSKCEKLYELIRKTCKVRNFLEALEGTGNEHILTFIKETLFNLD